MILKIKNIWNNYITSGMTNTRPEDVSLKIKFINIFGLIGSISLFAFGIVYIFNDNYFMAFFEIGLGLTTSLSILIFRKTHNEALITFYLVPTTMIIMLFLIITGGYKGGGILWFFLFPILTFQTLSARKGAFSVFLLYIFTILIAVLKENNIITTIGYSTGEIYQVLIILFPISTILYFSEKENIKNQEIIQSKTIELAYNNELLKDREILLKKEVEKKTRKVEHITLTLIKALENVNHLNDTDTGNHIQRVSEYSALLAQAYGCNHKFVSRIKLYATLHDVGKVALPDKILLKPDRYDANEFEQMKDHVIFGGKILSDDDLDVMAKNIALYHHEKWDGTGYPHNLKGKKIPLEARIVAVADVYDALSTSRPYKDPFAEGKIDNIMKAESGKHFDPMLIKAFYTIKDKIIKVKSRLQ